MSSQDEIAAQRPAGENSERAPLLPSSQEAIEMASNSNADRNRGIYWSFWILGAGVLLSWNVLMCSMPLFIGFLPAESTLRNTLTSYISTAFSFISLFMMGIAQKGVGKVSPSSRLHTALWLLAAAMALVTFPLLPFVLPRLGPAGLIVSLLALTVVLATSTSYLQSSVFAIAASWGGEEMLAVMSGQGGIAVLISVVQTYLAIITVYAAKDGEIGGAPAKESHGSVIAGMGLWGAGTLALTLCFLARRRILKHHKSSTAIEDLAEAADQYEAVRQQQDDEGVESIPIKRSASERADARLWKVFRKNAWLEFSVAWVFVITLAIFPAVTVTIVSVNPSPPRMLSPAVFIPLHFLLFNVADYVGRTYGPNIYMPTSHTRVTALSLARTIFIPLFLACNTAVKGRDAAHVPWINSDIGYFLVVFAFGVSNGYVSSLCMILSSSPSLNPAIQEEEKDLAGSLAAFALVGGLATGSLASFAVRWMVTGGNPLVS